MKKYAIELLGTFLFVLSIIGIIHNASALIGLYIGITLAALVYMGWVLSGAHYNPAVTLGLFINRKINSRDALFYIFAQLLWALFAYLIMRYGLDITIVPIALTSSLKAIFLAEMIFTFALVTVIYFTAVNKATAWNSYFGIAIGSIVAIGIVTMGGISGGFFNPAVLLWLGLYGVSLKLVCVIIGGQLLGSLGAAWFYRYIVGE